MVSKIYICYIGISLYFIIVENGPRASGIQLESQVKNKVAHRELGFQHVKRLSERVEVR